MSKKTATMEEIEKIMKEILELDGSDEVVHIEARICRGVLAIIDKNQLNN